MPVKPILLLPLLSVWSPFALASVAPEPSNDRQDARAPVFQTMEHTSATHSRSVSRRSPPRRLPRGDLRHCLELQDNLAIIRCAEKQR